MDPFSALAIAAAVVQFVDFGGKLLWRTWDQYKDRLAAREEDAEVTQIVNDLSDLAAGVRANTEWLWRDPNQPPSPAESQFLRLCGECDKITLEFHDALNRIKHRRLSRRSQTRSDAPPSAAKPQGRRAELAGVWDSNRIDAMRTRLERLRGEVMTAILFCLWYATFAFLLAFLLSSSLWSALPLCETSACDSAQRWYRRTDERGLT